MKCAECGNVMAKSVGDHAYPESGMSHVILCDTTAHTCGSCGAKCVMIVAMAQLHRSIARALSQKPARFIPSEVRFIRDYLELTNKVFAVLMGVTESQASRWTSTDPMGVPAEHFLRMLMALAFARDVPVEVARKPPTTEALFRLLCDTIKSFPPRSGGVTTFQLRAQRIGSDWDTAVQVDRVHATSVECPTCHAWVGWACEGRNYGYHGAGYHPARQRAAERVARASKMAPEAVANS